MIKQYTHEWDFDGMVVLTGRSHLSRLRRIVVSLTSRSLHEAIQGVVRESSRASRSGEENHKLNDATEHCLGKHLAKRDVVVCELGVAVRGRALERRQWSLLCEANETAFA